VSVGLTEFVPFKREKEDAISDELCVAETLLMKLEKPGAVPVSVGPGISVELGNGNGANVSETEENPDEGDHGVGAAPGPVPLPNGAPVVKFGKGKGAAVSDMDGKGPDPKLQIGVALPAPVDSTAEVELWTGGGAFEDHTPDPEDPSAVPIPVDPGNTVELERGKGGKEYEGGPAVHAPVAELGVVWVPRDMVSVCLEIRLELYIEKGGTVKGGLTSGEVGEPGPDPPVPVGTAAHVEFDRGKGAPVAEAPREADAVGGPGLAEPAILLENTDGRLAVGPLQPLELDMGYGGTEDELSSVDTVELSDTPVRPKEDVPFVMGKGASTVVRIGAPVLSGGA